MSSSFIKAQLVSPIGILTATGVDVIGITTSSGVNVTGILTASSSHVGILSVTNANVTGILTSVVVNDAAGNVRDIPQNSQSSSYTLQITDAGKHISISAGGVTVPSGVFNIGDAISIYNNSGTSQQIIQGGSVTLRKAGSATTGTRTLSQYGLATVLCVASNTFVVVGTGLDV